MIHTIEDLLELKHNDIPIKSLPLQDQIDFLTSEHFESFKHPLNQKWRLEHLYYILTKDGTRSLFTLNSAQDHFYTYYLLPGYKKIVILKSRQLGFTSLMSIYFLDQVLWNPNNEALQIAHTQKDALEIFNRKIVFAVKNLSPYIKDLIDISQAKSSRQQFSYDDGNGGEFISAINVSNSGRSGTYSVGVHISELAKLSKLFPGRAEEIITGTLPSVPVGGQVVIESTAEGAIGLFYEMFMGEWSNRDKITPAMSKAHFKPVFYNWTWDKAEIEKSAEDGIISVDQMEECEINWKEYQQENNLTDKELNFYYLKWVNANKDVDKLHQEYPTHPMEAFLSTGSPYFNSQKVSAMIDKCSVSYTRHSFINGEIIPDERGDIYIYEKPQKGKKYVIGGDVAEGLLNGDYSVAAVVGYDKKIKALYRGHCEPDEYAELVMVLGNLYNTALLVIEFNKDGNWVNTEIRNKNYPNIYVRTEVDDLTKEVTKHYGWLTNKGLQSICSEELNHFLPSPNIKSLFFL